MAGLLEDYIPVTNQAFNMLSLLDLSQNPYNAIPLDLLGRQTGGDTSVGPELPTPDTYNRPTEKSGDGGGGDSIGADKTPSIYEKDYWGGQWSPDGMFGKTGWSGLMQDLGYAKSSLGWNMKNTAMGPLFQSVLSGMATGPLGIVGMLGSILGAGAKSNNFLDPTVNKAMQEMFSQLSPDVQAMYGGWEGFADMMTGIYGTGPSANPKTATPISIDVTNPNVQAGFKLMGITNLEEVATQNPAALQALVLDMRVNNTATNVGMALDALARSGKIAGPTLDTLVGLRASGYTMSYGSVYGSSSISGYRGLANGTITPPKDLKAVYDFASRMGISPFSAAYAVAVLGEGVNDAGANVAASAVSSSLSSMAREISAAAMSGKVSNVDEALEMANKLTELSKTVTLDNFNTFNSDVTAAKSYLSSITSRDDGAGAGPLGAGPGITSKDQWGRAHQSFDPESGSYGFGRSMADIESFGPAKDAGERDKDSGPTGSEAGGLGTGGHGCFVAGTLVTMADNTTKAIEKVVKGDKVLTYDMDAQKLDTDVVKKTLTQKRNDMVTIEFENGTKITASPNHPFITDKGLASFSPSATMREDKRDVNRLTVGALVLTEDEDWVKVTKITKSKKEEVTVYNLPDIGGENTFFVNGICVHNMK